MRPNIVFQATRPWVVALLAAALAPASFAQSAKDEAHTQMIELQAQIASLKGRGDADALQQLASLTGQLDSLSASLGGDLPCAIGPADAGASPAGVGPVPPSGCTASTTPFSQNVPVAIPTGPAVVTSTMVVNGVGSYLWDVDLTTAIQHTFNADLDITISSPAGTVVTLTSDNGAGNDDVFNGTIWDDSANPGGQVPYTTNAGLVTDHPYVDLTVASPLVPEESLAAFVGEDPNGTWTITISDDLAGDGGSLNSWSLNLTTFAAAPNFDGVQSFDQTTAVAIPTGPAVVSSTLDVSGLTNAICNVELRSNITHTFNADLDITLTSPTGQIVTITTDNGAGNDDVYNGTLWASDANPAGQVPYTTNAGLVTDHPYVNLTLASPLVVEESLGAFLGADGNGTWTLTVSDDLAGDGGSIDAWGLDFTTCSCAVNADVSITKTDGVASVTAGTSTTYTIVAANAGPAAALGTSIVDNFPAACSSVNWTCAAAGGATCSAAGSGNIADLIDLPAGGTATYTAICAIDPAASGSLDNTATATVAGGITDPNLADNSATDSDTIGASADASISKVEQGVPVPTLIGSSFSYLLTASNTGPSTATNVVVTDSLPSTLTYVSNSCGATFAAPTLTWSVGTLAPAGNASCTVNVTVASLGAISNTANLSSATPDPTPANNSATSTLTGAQSVDVAISLTSNAGPGLAVGDNYTYFVTGTNLGVGLAGGLDFTLELSSKVSFVSSSCGAVLTGNTLSWSVATLADGASTSCDITVVVVLAGDIQATADVATATFDPDLSNNTAFLAVGTGAIPVPALGQFGLLLMMVLSLGVGVVVLRRN